MKAQFTTIAHRILAIFCILAIAGIAGCGNGNGDDEEEKPGTGIVTLPADPADPLSEQIIGTWEEANAGFGIGTVEWWGIILAQAGAPPVDIVLAQPTTWTFDNNGLLRVHVTLGVADGQDEDELSITYRFIYTVEDGSASTTSARGKVSFNFTRVTTDEPEFDAPLTLIMQEAGLDAEDLAATLTGDTLTIDERILKK